MQTIRMRTAIQLSSDNYNCCGSQILIFIFFYFTLGANYFFLINFTNAVILSGSSNSFARYPKWSQTFENELSFEFKTASDNALLLYTDDGGTNENFYALFIVDGCLQLHFRLDSESENIVPEIQPAIQIRIPSVVVDDGRWHKFYLFQAWENLKLRVDDVILFKNISQQKSFNFGGFRNNSGVFIGGLPKELEINSLSLPLCKYARKFAGTVINLRYRTYPSGFGTPQLIDSEDTRQMDDNYCHPVHFENMKIIGTNNTDNYCKHGGRCYSTNTGPQCDCSLTDYNGRQCEKHKPTQVISTFGNEWLGYDLTKNLNINELSGSKFGLLSIHQVLSFHFKTKNANGLLFVSGDNYNYIQLILEKGVLVAISKLHDTEKRIVRMFSNSTHNSNTNLRLDDNIWHHVVLYRDLKLMHLRVDGNWADEVQQITNHMSLKMELSNNVWLGHEYAFIGGAPKNQKHIPSYKLNFQGCLRKVNLAIDAIHLDLIRLADQGFEKSIIRLYGDVAFSCDVTNRTHDVVSFNNGNEFILLPKWNSLYTGNIGFQFRTYEKDGLLLYHGVRTFRNSTAADYIAFELIDGHIFVIINLGSGHIRIQASAKRVNEGNIWHSIILHRSGRTGTIMLDTTKTEFSTPGISANLIIDEPIYVGALPWKKTSVNLFDKRSTLKLDAANDITHINEQLFPATVWTAQLRKGFIGCIKNLHVSGQNVQISKIVHNERSKHKSSTNYGILTKCPVAETDSCAHNLCKNNGACFNALNGFKCDCSLTLYEGRLCSKKQQIITLPLNLPSNEDLNTSATNSFNATIIEFLKYIAQHEFDIYAYNFNDFNSNALHSEAENINFKFRTNDDSAVLFDTKGSRNQETRLSLILSNGVLELRVLLNNSTENTFNIGESLNDNQWHYVEIARRGAVFNVRVDDRNDVKRLSSIEPFRLGIYINQLAIGRYFKQEIESDLSDESRERSIFEGDFLSFYFNNFDVLEKIRRVQDSLLNFHQATNNESSLIHSSKSITSGTTNSSDANVKNKNFNNQKNISTPTLTNTISIRHVGGYVRFHSSTINKHILKRTSDIYRIFFRFRTLFPNGILFFLNNNGNNINETTDIYYVAISLINGRVQYAFVNKKNSFFKYDKNGMFRENNVITPMFNINGSRQRYDDLQWHSIEVTQNINTGAHHLRVDNNELELILQNAKKNLKIRGEVFIGGLSTNYSYINYNNDQFLPKSKMNGIIGCFSNLKLGRAHFNLWKESDFKENVENYCTGPVERCTRDTCRNSGMCRQGWMYAHCDCTWTTWVGPRCENESITIFYDGNGSAILYEFPIFLSSATMVHGILSENYPINNSDGLDFIVLAFSTVQDVGLLFSAQCTLKKYNFTLILISGYLQVHCNFGNGNHKFGDFSKRVDDGHRHIVRILRQHTGVTLSLDNHIPVKYALKSQREDYIKNVRWHISIGAYFDFNSTNNLRTTSPERRNCETHNVFNDFRGNISGFIFNGVPILQLFATNQKNIYCAGNPKILHMPTSQYYYDRKTVKDNVLMTSDHAKIKLETQKIAHSYGNLFETDDLPFTPNIPAGANARGSMNAHNQYIDSFINQSPLGCLPHTTATDCERDDQPQDGLITPVLPKYFNQPSRFQSSISDKASKQNHRSKSNKTPNEYNDLTSNQQKNHHSTQNVNPDTRSGQRQFFNLKNKNEIQAKMRNNVIIKPISYYEPPGGWPPRTRTGPDGRRIIPRPQIINKTRENNNEKVEENYDEEKNVIEDVKDNEISDESKENTEEIQDIIMEPPSSSDEENLKFEKSANVENLWTNLGQVIEQKPWQKTTSFYQQNNESIAKEDLTNKSINLKNLEKQQTTKPYAFALVPQHLEKSITSFTIAKNSVSSQSIPNEQDMENIKNVSIVYNSKIIPDEQIFSSRLVTTITTPTSSTITTNKTIALKNKASTTNASMQHQKVNHSSTISLPPADILFTYVAAHRENIFTATSISITPLPHSSIAEESTLRARTRTFSPYDHTLYAVRPTTPMNEIQYFTPKTSETYGTTLPRTAVVVLASLSLVLLVAVILIFVFCKKSSSSENYYPMICSGNGKLLISGRSGYNTGAASSKDSSPQFTHQLVNGVATPTIFENKVTSDVITVPRVVSNGVNAKKVMIVRSGSSVGTIKMEPGVYNPIQGTNKHIVNKPFDNGNSDSIATNGGTRICQTSTSRINNGCTSTCDGIQPIGKDINKKDFKEWYV